MEETVSPIVADPTDVRTSLATRGTGHKLAAGEAAELTSGEGDDVELGLSWDSVPGARLDVDLDAAAVVLDECGAVIDAAFYNQARARACGVPFSRARAPEMIFSVVPPPSSRHSTGRSRTAATRARAIRKATTRCVATPRLSTRPGRCEHLRLPESVEQPTRAVRAGRGAGG